MILITNFLLNRFKSIFLAIGFQILKGVVPWRMLFNFIPIENIDSCFYENMIFKETKSLNHLGYPLPSKVCHRGFSDVIVTQGNHSLAYPENIKIMVSDLIEIFHFPMRSYRQFENKIKLGGAAYERNKVLDKKVGRGWRNLFEKYKSGGLQHYYQSKTLGLKEIKARLNSGELIVDTRLRNYLRKFPDYRLSFIKKLLSFFSQIHIF